MTWAKSTMPDGVLSSIECIQHSMRLRLVETSSSLPTARVSGRSVSRRSATSVVGVDAAPEMRELALAKLQDAGKSNVELWVDDLFSWQPDQDYDVVFFAFWLSHVPESHTDRFWRSVHDALRPGGRFFLVDAARAVLERNVIHGSRLPDRESATELRRLEDGREFRIFKRSFDPDRLARDLRDHGLDASFVETGEFFVYGLGRRA